MGIIGVSTSSGNLIIMTLNVAIKRLKTPIQFSLYGALISSLSFLESICFSFSFFRFWSFLRRVKVF